MPLSNIIRKFNRFELKYLITLKQAEQIKYALGAYLIPDEHGREDGGYAITSLYYDSPDYRCYWEKLDGVKYRRKLRIRYYEMEQGICDDTPVFIEIKQRFNRVTQKRRTILPYCEALSLCDGRSLPPNLQVDNHVQEDKAILEEVHAFLWQYNLLPASIVRYKRQAFIGTDYDLGLRVTFDTDLTYQVRPLILHTIPDGLRMLPPEYLVMEIKVNERIPYWLTEIVAAHNLSTVRLSKYCRSLEIANGFPASHAFRLSAPIDPIRENSKY